jgi:3-dehydroquinate synthase
VKESGSAPPARTTVPVSAGAGGYPVVIGVGLMADVAELVRERVDAHRYAIVSDDNVAALHVDALLDRFADAGLDATLLTFPAGEVSKTRKSWSILTDEMLDAGMGRDCCVVAVGGGVTTDLAGFVAATYMRGVSLVQVPTSYLAMIDAAVGGKTGIDTHHGKNLVGAFHAPELVVVDPTVLDTLPLQERAEGLVEAFKHGAILDAAYLELLRERVVELLAAEPAAALEAVTRSVQLKAAVVADDEREGGYRHILNFGHTVGHALEAAADFGMGHGTAVAFGMIAEARIGEALGVTERGTAERLREALSGLGLDSAPRVDPDRIVRHLSADKKSRSGRARYVLLRGLGSVDSGVGWTHEVDVSTVLDALVA